jgi:glycosyltransferase involved in cell wall biosynthesis
MPELKISIITVCFNSHSTVSDTVDSVLAQTYPHIEYIVVDGASSDGTREIVSSYGTKISRFISEPDRGIYDALNKGIRAATGDIIGILNSDDVFYNESVIAKIAEAFEDKDLEAIISDVQFVDPVNTSKVIRYYSSRNFTTARFRFGFMPAHPGFYVKRELFEKFGYYKTDYKIAADYELEMRFLLTNHINYRYLQMPVVSMRKGGVSNKSILSNYILNKEIARACKENGLSTNVFFIYSKYFLKIFQFFGNRKLNQKISLIIMGLILIVYKYLQP